MRALYEDTRGAILIYEYSNTSLSYMPILFNLKAIKELNLYGESFGCT